MAGDDPIRRRSACDRCHSQKLRCPRRPGVETCDRCARACACCVYSPFRQKNPVVMEIEEFSQAPGTGTPPPLRPDESEVGDHSSISMPGIKRKRIGAASPREIYPAEHLISDTIGTFNWMAGQNPEFQDLQDLNQFDFDNISAMSMDHLLQNTSDQEPYGQVKFPLIDSKQTIGRPNGHNLSTSEMMSSVSQTTSSGSSQQGNSLLQLCNPNSLSFYHAVLDNTEAEPNGSGHKVGSRGSSSSQVESTRVAPELEKDVICQLAELSVGLYEHIKSIPPISIHDSLPRFKDTLAAGENAPNPQIDPRTYNFKPEDTFSLSQKLVDVYPNIMSIFFPDNMIRPPYMGDGDFDAWILRWRSTNDDLCNERDQRSEIPHFSTPAPIDQSSLLLLLSCHLRLLDIFDKLFEHMHICTDSGLGAYNVGTPFQPPQVRVGSFVAPPSSAIPMQMLLFIQLASQLSEYASVLHSKIRLTKHGEGANTEDVEETGKMRDLTPPQDSVTWTIAESVKRRAKRATEEISRIRGTLLQRGFFA